jgi:hypothetical protein
MLLGLEVQRYRQQAQAPLDAGGISVKCREACTWAHVAAKTSGDAQARATSSGFLIKDSTGTLSVGCPRDF